MKAVHNYTLILIAALSATLGLAPFKAQAQTADQTGINPSQIVSGSISAGSYNITTTDGQDHTGTVTSHVDANGSGVVTSTDNQSGAVTISLVHDGLTTITTLH